MIKRIIILICVACGVTTMQARDRQCFDQNWRFNLGDSAIHAKTDFDDSKWRLLDVPHDWAIEGDFYVSNPSGAGGGALPGGIGWYRKHFEVKSEEVKSEKVIVFRAESDALIVKGIVSLLIRVLSGHTPQEILDADLYFIGQIGLREHLSPTRSNGLLAMVKQMRAYALAFSAKR